MSEDIREEIARALAEWAGWKGYPTNSDYAEADALMPLVARIQAEAWDKGYMRGRYPWTHEDQVDPIPEAHYPPTKGANANPYRADRLEQGNG